MRSLLVIIDGLGDDHIPALNGLTPFQYAEHKNIDTLIKLGTYSEVSICENDFIPESLSCILRLLGVQQRDFPTNRAYLELLAHGRDISEYEMVLRCNLVSIDKDNTLVSFNGQGLSAESMAEAAKACDEFWQGIEFMHLSRPMMRLWTVCQNAEDIRLYRKRCASGVCVYRHTHSVCSTDWKQWTGQIL